MKDLIRPWKIEDKKIRLGPQEDGGYVCSESCLLESSALFTYGVGHEIRYEQDYSSMYNKPVYMYDHTIGRETGWNIGANLFFFNEGLGFSDKCDDFLNHYRALNVKDRVLLKIDVEGAEYDYFEKVDLYSLYKCCTGILLEFHWLSNESYRERFKKIVKDLSKYFTLTHIHGNAWSTLFELDGNSFPDVIELSYVNNDLISEKTPDLEKYPVKNLDYSNRPGYDDVDLSFLTE